MEQTRNTKDLLKIPAYVVDALLSPFVALGALVMKLLRGIGLRHLPVSRAILNRIGIFPLHGHYYEPLFRAPALPMDQNRDLPGLDMNVAGQLELLSQFNFMEELKQIPESQRSQGEFYYHNKTFESGDAEYWYSIIRLFKPHKIIEVGSGNSTLLARKALAQNRKDDQQYECLHICIEPFEAPWLEAVEGIQLLRSKIEDVGIDIFKTLGENDVLFIDSSHVLRAQGDVEHEYLRILPVLKPGVLIHIHDIFTPRDYLLDWKHEDHKLFYNEQYLLEAFLTFNHDFRIMAGVNFLRHRYPKEISERCPMLAREIAHREPGSFWIRRIKSSQQTTS